MKRYIYLFRHGTTTDNAAGKFSGFRDVSLNKRGIEDAKIVALRLKDKKFDVAFCLGSLNFGSNEKITSEINSVINLLKPKSRIYWRSNPGKKDHHHNDCEKINFFPWTFEIHKKFSKEFGFECIDLKWDNNNRIYAEWSRM